MRPTLAPWSNRSFRASGRGEGREEHLEREKDEEEVKDEWLGQVHEKNAWKSEGRERENTAVFHVF